MRMIVVTVLAHDKHVWPFSPMTALQRIGNDVLDGSGAAPCLTFGHMHTTLLAHRTPSSIWFISIFSLVLSNPFPFLFILSDPASSSFHPLPSFRTVPIDVSTYAFVLFLIHRLLIMWMRVMAPGSAMKVWPCNTGCSTTTTQWVFAGRGGQMKEGECEDGGECEFVLRVWMMVVGEERCEDAGEHGAGSDMCWGWKGGCECDGVRMQRVKLRSETA